MAWYSRVLAVPFDRLERIEKQFHLISERMSIMNETLSRLLTEATETKGRLATAIVIIKGFPAVVQAKIDAAVAEVLAKNPGLTPEDLAAMNQVSEELNAEQSEFDAAIAANAEPEPTAAPPVEPPA
jgi:hypothetical protein